MLPITDEEIANDAALDEKLTSVFEAETAREDPKAEDTSTVEPEADKSESEPAEEPVEPEERLRDEAGRYLPKFDDPDVQDYLTKYGGDVGEALKAATHAYRLIGKRDDEREDLKQQIQELRSQFEQQQQPQRPQTDQTALIEYLEENPAAITSTINGAWANGDRNSVYTAIGVLAQYDAAQAEAYRSEIAKQDALAAIREEQAARDAQASQLEGSRSIAERAFASYESKNPDARRLAAEMFQVAEQAPRLLGVLQGDDPEAMEEVFDYLYTKAEKAVRGRDSDTLETARATKAAEQKQQAQTAKENAAVGSASSTPDQAQKSPKEQWRDDFRTLLFDDSTSIRSGLTTD